MKHASLEFRFRQVLVLTGFLVYLGAVSLSFDQLKEADLGWHLKSGEWLIRNLSLPIHDPFSLDGGASPWYPYSWLYEIVLYGFTSTMGLKGTLLLTCLLSGIGLWLAFLLLGQARIQRTQAIMLGALFLMGISTLYTPRPWLFNIDLFLLELILADRYYRTGKTRDLLYLPLIFLLWANIHIQFIYGLYFLGILWLEAIITDHLRRERKSNNHTSRDLGWALVLSTLACFITPDPLALMHTLISTIQQTGVRTYVLEMRAMAFRSISDWAIMALVLLTVHQLKFNREQLSRWVLLLTGIVLAFTSARDVWFLAALALWAQISSQQPHQGDEGFNLEARDWILALPIAALFLTGLFLKHFPAVDSPEAHLAKRFPVAATELMNNLHYPGPIFNHYDWGGFLIWKLKDHKVSMDGRANLYGDPRIERHIETWNGGPNWDQNPELLRANTIIAPKVMALTSLLRERPEYQLVYEDALACIFIRKTLRPLEADPS